MQEVSANNDCTHSVIQKIQGEEPTTASAASLIIEVCDWISDQEELLKLEIGPSDKVMIPPSLYLPHTVKLSSRREYAEELTYLINILHLLEKSAGSPITAHNHEEEHQLAFGHIRALYREARLKFDHKDKIRAKRRETCLQNAAKRKKKATGDYAKYLPDFQEILRQNPALPKIEAARKIEEKYRPNVTTKYLCDKLTTLAGNDSPPVVTS